MIEIYSGFVGSGKSYHAVRRGTLIADAPVGDRWVIANFPIKAKKKLLARVPILGDRIKEKYNKPRWIYKDNDELTVDFLVKFSYDYAAEHGEVKEGQFLLILDEAGIMFNSRDWNVKPEERKNWIKFLAQSRKLGFDIVFIVQDGRMLDRQIRSLAEYEVQHKKMNNWQLFKFIPVTMFACVSFWNGVRNIRGSLEMCLYRKSVADRYDTKALFGYAAELVADAGGGALEGGSLRDGNQSPDITQTDEKTKTIGDKEAV